MPTIQEVQDFETSLKPWLEEEGIDQDQIAARAEARRRIVQAYQEDSTRLDLNGLQITSLPAEMGSLVKLTELDLRSNRLTTLPEWIGDLTSLTSLNLSFNQLTTLPERIGDLTALRNLHLTFNQLTTLPESIGNLTALTYLNLFGNPLTELPERIGDLTALTYLNLSYNQLTTLPESIGGLTALTSLYLINNRLTTLPESIGGLNALTILNLYDNRLTTLPESIGGLTALTFLYLSFNPLTTLPESIGGLNALTHLYLGVNQLTTLPESIGGLNALTFLSLFNNQLTILPESIGGLNALRGLYLGGNQLTILPEKIWDLNLTKLNLNNNPLTPSPTLLDRLSELETRGCDIRYPNEITREVRADRAEWHLQQSRLQQVSRTLSVASCDPKSHLSKLEYGVMDEVLKFTDTRLLSEAEKKAVFEATEKGLKETDMYKRYVEANSKADNQELKTKSVTASPAEVIASEEAEERSYKSDYEDLRSSEERSSSHQASHQGVGGAAAEEGQETAAITEASRERAEEPRVGATASRILMWQFCDLLSSPFRSSKVHPETSISTKKSVPQRLLDNGNKGNNKVTPSRD